MSTAKVFVGSLPPGCKPEELRHLFTSYGVVVECDIMNRCGFVHLETVEMAEASIAALNGIEFKGQAIVVEPGRPKDRRGGGGGGGAAGGGGSEGGRAANRRPMQGGSFNRGGHMSGNSFRGGAGGGRGNNRTSNSNDSHFGPMRNEGSFRQQRNAPYSKQNQSTDAPPQQAFNKNKFNQSGGYTDFHNGSHGGHRGGGFGAAKNIGQDRRGFALPAVDHHHQQQQQQMSFGSANKQGRFGNGPLPSGNSADNGIFQRQRNNLSMNSGSTHPGRGGFSANRGGFTGRGGFNARRGGSGQNSSQSGNFNKHGPTNGHHNQQHNNAPNSYQSDFPPLGSQGGSVPGRNRFNGPPRAALNMGGGNRRF